VFTVWRNLYPLVFQKNLMLVIAYGQAQVKQTSMKALLMLRNPYNATFIKLFSADKNSNLFRADLIVYINILGVVYMLLHSIYLRKYLVGMSV
jgi:hypothetical protein